MSISATIRAVQQGDLSYEDGLDALTVAPAADVDSALAAAVGDGVDRLVRGGWQPAELHRVVARLGDPVKAGLVVGALQGYLPKFPDLDPRWRAQVDELPAAPRGRARPHQAA